MNEDAAVMEEEQTAAAETAGSISVDDIEYTLLIHEVPDLTIPVPVVQPEDETIEADEPAEAEEPAEEAEEPEDAEDAPEEATSEPEEDAKRADKPAETTETAETAETAGPVSDDDIEYTLLIHEVSDLTIPLPGMQPADEPDEVEKAAEEADEPAEPEEAAEEADKPAEPEEAAEEPEEAQETSYGLPADHADMNELAQRIEARRRYNERKKRNFRTRFYVITTILVLIIAFMLISLSSLFTVDSIEVKGNQHYTAEEIINMGHAGPGHNLIYHLNRQETEEYLEQNPYIKNATVSRKLPSTIVIKVTERAEKMAFRYDDDYLIMDEDGILLKKTRNVPKATLVEGIVVNKIKLGEKIGAEDSKRLDRAIDLIHSMTSADMYFVRIDMSKDDIIKAYIYETLAVKADFDTLKENLENGRLHLVVEKLFSEGIVRGTITFEEDGTASFMPGI